MEIICEEPPAPSGTIEGRSALMTEEAVTLAETDVEEAIVATLVREPGVPITSKTGGSGWTASVGSGGGPGADPATIVFQKTRILPTCQMHSVAFTNNRGIPVEEIIRTWQKSDGSWAVAPVGGGGDTLPCAPSHGSTSLPSLVLTILPLAGTSRAVDQSRPSRSA